ncbi:MAG: hypothetical protein LCH95_13005 [Proteobacteria bacterium]|nr:hypothetical protein [Pseudomonadota bacterium]
MSVGEQGGVTVSKTREDARRQPRRRWRTLQNRIERARQLRQAAADAAGKGGRPAGNGPATT